MWTSTASKPARSNATAISTCPFTPCSRRMAMRGRAPPAVGVAGLDDGAELLVEHRAEHELARAAGELLVGVALEGVDVIRRGVEGEPVQVQRHAAMAGEGHLADGGEEAAVGAVVVGEDQ